MARPEKLPFFPLSLVALPLQPFKLHIFEPRYIQLFKELQVSGGEFVSVPVIDSRLQPFATVINLVELSAPTASGELDVDCVGVRVVRIQSFEEKMTGKLYGGGEVLPVRMSMVASHGALTARLLTRCTHLLLLLGAHRDLPDLGDPGISFSLGHWLGLRIHEEYALLTMATEDERQAHLAELVEKRIETAKDTMELRHRAQLNGHFRYVGDTER